MECNKPNMKQYSIISNSKKYTLKINILESNEIKFSLSNDNDNNLQKLTTNSSKNKELYEALYTYKDFAELNAIFKIYSNLNDIFNILNQIIENNRVQIKTIHNSLEIFLILKISIIVKEEEIYIPLKNTNTKNNSSNINEDLISNLKTEIDFMKKEINKLKNIVENKNNEIQVLFQENEKIKKRLLNLEQSNQNNLTLSNKNSYNSNNPLNKSVCFSTKNSKNLDNSTEEFQPKHSLLNSNVPIRNLNTNNNNMNGDTSKNINNSTLSKTNVKNENNESKEAIETKNEIENTFQKEFLTNGDIIQNKSELELISNKIKKFDPDKKVYYSLIYKGTKDGDLAKTFHARCDKIPNQLVLVQTTKGKRFGGFTAHGFDAVSNGIKDPEAFLFSLDKMETYDAIKDKETITCEENYGPCFGWSSDLLIPDKFFSSHGEVQKKNNRFKTNLDFELTGGEPKFQFQEVEVFQTLIDSNSQIE